MINMADQKPSEKILLLAIRRPYSRLILSGKKKFELRKRMPKSKCKYALIYETLPTKAVIGYFKINQIYIDNTQNIWKTVTDKACVNREEFDNYYENKLFAVAIEIKESMQFDNPVPLAEIGINFVPQDFVYVENKEAEKLIRI
jgi:predicted transcriptional regulator